MYTENDVKWYAAECGIQDAIKGAAACPELWFDIKHPQWDEFKRTYHNLYQETRKSYEQIQILDS